MLRWILEIAILAAVAGGFVRRAGIAVAPFDRPLALIVAALVGQSVLAWVPSNGHGAAAWTVLAVRAVLVLAALAAWLSIVRSCPDARWRMTLLIVAAGVLTLGVAGLRIAAYVAVIVAVAGMEWPKGVQGWRRAVGLALVLPLAAFTAIDPTGAGGLESLRIGLELEGAVKGAELGQPFVQAIRVVLAILRVQLVVAFFRFLLLPVGLRSLPLARRFAVNFTLTRSIPGFLSTVTLFAVVVLGYGLHKAAEARREMDGSLARASAAAAVLLEEVPFDEALARARLTLGQDAERARMVLRRAEAALTDPPGFAAEPAFPADPAAKVGGLLVVDRRLFLVAREREGTPDPAGIAEVWVPVDEGYLGGFSERALIDVELRAMPNVKLGAVAVSFDSEEVPTEAPVVVRSPAVTPEWAAGHKPLVRTFPVSRLFLPIGNWSDTGEEGRRGAVGVTLRGSLHQVIRAVRRNPYILTSNAVPFLILGGLGVLIGIVEALSVRTGRSIVQAVLDDVKTLEIGAERIGGGNLDHRIPAAGKDELSKLGRTLNTMAANLKRQRDELVDKERLEADLEVARSIQQRLLPQGPPVVAGTDVAGVSIPSRVVGGDLFYFLPFEEGRLGLAIGDVSGKSVPAALLMSNVIAVLRAEAQIGVAVDESLSRINRLIAEQIEPNRFVTLFYGVVDRTSDLVRYACAGHNPPLLLHADRSVTWLTEGGTPLGVVADTRYRTATTRFAAGDVLVLYTDGVTEAESAATEELFGEPRLVEAVTAARDGSAAEILEAVLASLSAFSGGRPPSDDRTLVVVRAT